MSVQTALLIGSLVIFALAEIHRRGLIASPDRLNRKQLVVLRLLGDARHGLRGLEVVEQSRGQIQRRHVYVVLGKLVMSGLVHMEKPTSEPGYPGMPRPVYSLPDDGVRALVRAGGFRGNHGWAYR